MGINTVKRMELTDEITGSARTLWKIQTALEAAGVEFIPADDEKGPGLLDWRLAHFFWWAQQKEKVPAGVAGTAGVCLGIFSEHPNSVING